MSKVFKNYVGIDISKSWFDAALICTEVSGAVVHKQFAQTPEGYHNFSKWMLSHNVALNNDTLICMEYTGIYNTGLVDFLVDRSAHLWVEMPLRIKRAGGLQRGGDDKSDASKIAWYALRHADAVKLWKPVDKSIETIKHLIAQRDRIMTAVNNLLVPVEELRQCGCKDQGAQLERIQRSAVKALQKAQKEIEIKINQTIKQDEELDAQATLLQRVPGIGKVTAVSLLVYTKGFTAFDTAKQLACYCGVVPFQKMSGSSVRYKPSVSPFANMKLKRLLHLCALSAIQNNTEMKAYYQRKLLEGKNKMSVINAVRNKILHRAFAVVRDNRIFEENYIRKCA